VFGDSKQAATEGDSRQAEEGRTKAASAERKRRQTEAETEAEAERKTEKNSGKSCEAKWNRQEDFRSAGQQKERVFATEQQQQDLFPGSPRRKDSACPNPDRDLKGHGQERVGTKTVGQTETDQKKQAETELEKHPRPDRLCPKTRLCPDLDREWEPPEIFESEKEATDQRAQSWLENGEAEDGQ
jgi:hypothetical protein